MAKQPHLITLHVALEDIAPPIWRRIEVDADITLRGLHHVIQAAFGWASSHLYQFRIDERVYTKPNPDAFPGRGPAAVDDSKAVLMPLVQPGQAFSYLYDFGDDWLHTVTIEKIEAIGDKMGYATIVDGERACPPEDIGGPFSYESLLEAMRKKPNSEEVQDFLQWMGGAFDAEMFDRRLANSALLRMGSNGWGKK